MHVLIFGGAGFVGLNIAQALLERGYAVTLFDCAELPQAAQRAFAPVQRLAAVGTLRPPPLPAALAEDEPAAG